MLANRGPDFGGGRPRVHFSLVEIDISLILSHEVSICLLRLP